MQSCYTQVRKVSVQYTTDDMFHNTHFAERKLPFFHQFFQVNQGQGQQRRVIFEIGNHQDHRSGSVTHGILGKWRD